MKFKDFIHMVDINTTIVLEEGLEIKFDSPEDKDFTKYDDVEVIGFWSIAENKIGLYSNYYSKKYECEDYVLCEDRPTYDL